MEGEMAELREELAVPPTSNNDVEGDGRAVFIDLGTEEEFEDFVKKEEQGWGSFLKKIFNPSENDETNS